jgi:hypothetical protein
MKALILAIGLASALLGGRAALADNADDMKWVAQCLKDNQDAKVSVGIVAKYCTCMNNKMSENETQSITQWEKHHVTERKACDRESGWN